MSTETHDTRQRSTGDIDSVGAVEISARNLTCPAPIIKLNEGLKALPVGTKVRLVATDRHVLAEIENWSAATGNRLITTGVDGNDVFALVEKSGVPQAQAAAVQPSPVSTDKTILLFSDDFDRVLAALVVANGALALGRRVTLYVTFWGLNALKKKKAPPVKKDILSAMFGLMMPKGAAQLTLSKLNMLGIGTGLMRYIMRKKQVDSIESLLDQALKNGAEVIACQLALDVMGISPTELLDGVKVGGVAAFILAAERSGTSLVF